MLRRVFFEVTLHDWVVRHDLHGNGNIMKTIFTRGQGYDRPDRHDEINLDLKVHQGDTTLQEFTQKEVMFDTPSVITPMIRAVLESMKCGEKVSAILKPTFVQEIEPNLEFNKSEPVTIDATLNSLCKITDMYRDGTTFYKTLRKGEGSGSPYYDCKVTLKVRIEVDGEEKFCHSQFESMDAGDEECATFDLEEYTVPGVIRKIIKTAKQFEIIQVRCRRRDKLIDHIDDSIFRHEWLGNFKEEVVITFSWVNYL